MFENPRTGKQARSFTKNVPKILYLKSSFVFRKGIVFSENWRWVPLFNVGLTRIGRLGERSRIASRLCDRVCNAMGASVSLNDIDIAHRVPLRDSTREGPKLIVCKFTRRLARKIGSNIIWRCAGQQGQRDGYRFRRKHKHCKRKGGWSSNSQDAKTLCGCSGYQQWMSLCIVGWRVDLSFSACLPIPALTGLGTSRLYFWSSLQFMY